MKKLSFIPQYWREPNQALLHAISPNRTRSSSETAATKRASCLVNWPFSFYAKLLIPTLFSPQGDSTKQCFTSPLAGSSLASCVLQRSSSCEGIPLRGDEAKDIFITIKGLAPPEVKEGDEEIFLIKKLDIFEKQSSYVE